MSVRVEDETGHLNIYMREKAALSLSRTDSKEEFEASRANDALDFPNKASSKSFAKPQRRKHQLLKTVLISLLRFSATSWRQRSKPSRTRPLRAA